MRLRILARADRDLEHIYEQGVDMFGFDAATNYTRELAGVLRLLSEQPRLGRERSDLGTRIRMHAHASHVIFYRIDQDEVAIVRVLHGRQDWRQHLA